ncbi:MAG: ring-opening amidohydrolase, partial [Alphaproteobacteria bacterium]|nr:ring-opening amidohydrolase [Alphaproteobacteria bacterium]
VNDFTRAYSVDMLKLLFAERLGCSRDEVPARIAIVMSGGTEGGLSPHLLVVGVREHSGDGTDQPALAVGTAFTRDFLPEEQGRMTMVHETAEAVRRAMAAAALDSTDAVHFVQVKCPLLTSERIADAYARGRDVVTADTYASMSYTRGASALGIALALGELDESQVTDAAIGHDWSLYSGRASASAGVELLNCEVIVLGNSPHWTGDKIITHDVMRDAIDAAALWRALANAGLGAPPQLDAEACARLDAVLCKAEPATTGEIRGNRHIMIDDSDINATRHARALVGGVVAGAVGRTDVFVSGGAEHQGPDGGGPVAVIARRPAA